MLTSSFPRIKGDVWGPWILDFSKELINQGLKVYVVAPHYPSIPRRTILDNVPTTRFKYWLEKSQVLASPPGILPNLNKYKLAKFQVLPYLLSALLTSIHVIKKNNVQIIHCQWTIPSGFIGYFLSKITKRPFVISIQGAELFLSPKSILGKFSIFSMSKCDLLLPVSDNMKKMALKIYPNIEHIFVLPNAVNVDVFKPKNKKKMKKGKNKIFKVLTVRRLVSEKRVDVLLKAFAEFAKDKNDVELLIGGDGTERENLEELSIDLDIMEKTKFLGFVNHSQLNDLYNSANVYVLTSEQEGLSLSLLEALASSVPVISTNIVGNPEVVMNGQTGFLFSPGNVKQLLEQLDFIYSNSKIAQKIGLRARKFTIKEYSTEIIMGRLIRYYKMLLKKRRT